MYGKEETEVGHDKTQKKERKEKKKSSRENEDLKKRRTKEQQETEATKHEWWCPLLCLFMCLLVTKQNRGRMSVCVRECLWVQTVKEGK